MALRTYSAYCTTSTDALLVLARLIPLHFESAGKRVLFESKGADGMAVTSERKETSFDGYEDKMREKT